jgi:uncharacterized NAD(P)/FAD-binding protein YdhS
VQSAQHSPQPWQREEHHVSAAPRTIVIVGAGFSGTSVALHLLRLGRELLKVVLLDTATAGRGLAYARCPYPYLLNVPAGRMSASEDPRGFLRFAQTRLPHASAADFLPRELYGGYLEAALAAAERSAAAQAHLERVRGLAIAVEKAQRGTGFQVHLADGRRLRADALVLALGNPPPAPLPGTETLGRAARCIQDPWATPQQFRPGETVLLVGSGLTMADVALAGIQSASGSAQVHAISRHGLLPAPQSPFEPAHGEADGRPLLRAASVSIRSLLRAARALAADIQQRQGDWREAIACVRALAPALWQRLPQRERRRFLRHLRCYWDVHRHRLPPRSSAALRQLRHSGELVVHAGRILRFTSEGQRIRVTWRARGEHRSQTLLVDRVVNCTGPDYDLRRTGQPLLRSLLAQGLACPDPLGVGLVTDEFGALTGAAGRGAADLYYVGPLLRATHWETTAVPELRHHAARLAQHLVMPRSERSRASPGSRPPARAVQLHV